MVGMLGGEMMILRQRESRGESCTRGFLVVRMSYGTPMLCCGRR